MRALMLPCAFVLSLVIATPTHAQQKRNITIDDYFTQADIFGLAYSQKYIAYSEGRWQESTDDRKTDLWIVPTAGGPARRLTNDRSSARSPVWSSDGKTIYFLANRKKKDVKAPPFDGKTQVWRIDIDGKAEPQAVTTVAGGVDAFDLAHESNSLYYLVHVDKIEHDDFGLRAKFPKLEYGHGHNRHGQIWLLDLENSKAEKLIDKGRNIREFAVSPDDRRIAMITTPDDKVVSFEGESRVDIWDSKFNVVEPLPDVEYRKQMPSPYGWLEKLAWSPSGTRLAFGIIFDAYPAELMIADLGTFDQDEPHVFKLNRNSEVQIRGYGSPMQWTADSLGLMFLAEDKGRVRLCVKKDVYDLTTEKGTGFEILTKGDVVVESFDARATGFGMLMATPTSLADIYAKEEKGDLKKVTNVNPQIAEWKLPQLSVVSWKGAGGQTVEGILELPHDYKKGDKLPLVVEIHGGPTTATLYKLQYWIYGRTLLPGRGYAVLCPNYRGSTGYGDKFTTDLIGRENDLDVEDILKGVDALVERGIADPDRLAVSGWSNGGYLTNCIITKTNRFKAAISGAGIIDAVMEWGSNDEPAYTMVFKQGFPWNAAEKYHKASPTYQLDRVKTPTLIHVGANDERCPPGQSRMLYRALKEYNKTPTELIVYPGEGHGISKLRNRRAKMEWDLAWLDRYVLGK